MLISVTSLFLTNKKTLLAKAGLNKNKHHESLERNRLLKYYKYSNNILFVFI